MQPTRNGFFALFRGITLLLASIIGVFALALVHWEQSPSLAAKNVIESFGIHDNSDRIVAPVSIAGRVYMFAIDTGCSATVYDLSLKRMLKPTGESLFLNNRGRPIYRAPKATVGRSRLPLREWAVCLDLSNFQSTTGQKVSGILGMDFLRHYVLKIDFDGRRASILRTSDGLSGRAMSMDFNPFGCPTVAVDMPTIGESPFVVDTGHSGISTGDLSKETFDRLVESEQIADIMEVRRFDIDGKYTCRTGRLASFCALDRHEQQVFNEGKQNSLGLSYLSRYSVTFDFPQARLILAPGSQFLRLFKEEVVGLSASHERNVIAR